MSDTTVYNVPSPGELTDQKNQKAEERVGLMVPKIVDHLSKHWNGSSVNYTCDGLIAWEIEAIKRIFGSKGWVVTYNSDQREGGWLTFKAQPATSHRKGDWFEAPES